MYPLLLTNRPRKDLAGRLAGSVFCRRLLGPGMVFAALMVALAELVVRSEVLRQPGQLVSDLELGKKLILLLTVAVAGIKVHHTFSFGQQLVERLDDPRFRVSELVWYGTASLLLGFTLFSYPYNLLVCVLVAITVVWEVYMIARLPRQSSRHRGKQRLPHQ